MRFRLSAAGGLFALLCLIMGVSAQTPSTSTASTAPAYASDPKFKTALAEGAQLTRRRQFSFAADSFKKANKIAGGQCMDCLRGLYAAQVGGGSFKDAASTAEVMEGLATDPASKSAAEYRRASALYEGAGDKPKPDKLAAMHGILLLQVRVYNV